MSDVFPLHLSPFEEFMLLDEHPGYRMTFLVEQSFDGEIDRAAFDAGVTEALRRHPLLRANVRQSFFRRWSWVAAKNAQPQVDWASHDEPAKDTEDIGIDLRRDIGVRFVARVGNGRSRLVTQFHHACCDGMGAIQFLSDLFAKYTRVVSPHAASQPAYQPAEARHLRKRADLKVYTDRSMSRWQLFRRVLKYARHYSAYPPVALAGSRLTAKPQTPLAAPGTLTRTLPLSAQHALRRIARRWDVSVNELLIRELMLTIRDWNERQGTLQDTDHISIFVPTNLRNLEHDQLPAANVVGFVAFQRSVAEMNEPERLLESIQQESRFYKRWRFGAAFLDALKVVHWIPGALRRVVNSDHSFGSAIFSCLGDPSLAITANFPVNADGNPIFGNLVFDDLNTAPPIRPNTHAAFTTWHFSNKLRLGVRCDAAVFSQESAQELLDLFADRVVALASTSIEERSGQREAA